MTGRIARDWGAGLEVSDVNTQQIAADVVGIENSIRASV